LHILKGIDWMNYQPTAPQFDNPWKDRSKFEPMPKGRTALQMAMLVLSSLALPLSLFHEAVAPVVLLVLFGYVIVAVRTPATVLSVLLSAVLPVLLIGTFASGALMLSCIVGVACGTWLVTVHKRAFWTLLLPVASFGISFAITGDWMLSAIALFPIPAIVLLRIAVLRGEKRTTAICFAEGGLLLSLVILIGAWLYTACKSLDQAAIAAYIESLRQELTQLLMSVRDVLLENLKVAGESNPAAYERLAASMSDATLLGIVQQLFNLIPAFAVVVCSIIAYEAQMLLNFIYRFTGMKQVVTPVSFVFTMSIPAAVLYMVSFFVSVFATGSSLAVALMDNLCLMLLPGFLLVGFGSMLTAFAAMKRNGGGFLLILAFALLCCCSSSALYLLALWGANMVLTAPLRRKMMQMTDNDNQNSDSP
jgi:hypothetical protein